jgi:isoquinoline 1-oxidoreductase subunit alpha
MTVFEVNGNRVSVDAEPDAPLLWVLREHLKLTGTKFGCGIGQCGACMVHIDGQTGYSCLTPVSSVEGKKITTIEGLSRNGDHPLQKAWIDLEVPQCGYCQSGQIMRAATLLAANSNPGRDEIVNHMSTNLCRCSTYPTIIEAIQQASREIRNED